MKKIRRGKWEITNVLNFHSKESGLSKIENRNSKIHSVFNCLMLFIIYFLNVRSV